MSSFLSLVASCCVLLHSAPTNQEVREIKPVRSVAYFKKHIWPRIAGEKSILPANTYFVDNPTRTFPEGSVLLKENPAKGTITISGPKQRVNDLWEVLDFCNIEPRKIKLSVNAEIIGEGMESQMSVTTDNNSTWAFDDEVTELHLSLKPRLNDDGTTTINVISIYRGSRMESTLRAAENKVATLVLPGDGALPKSERAISDKPNPGDLRIRIDVSLPPLPKREG